MEDVQVRNQAEGEAPAEAQAEGAWTRGPGRNLVARAQDEGNHAEPQDKHPGAEHEQSKAPQLQRAPKPRGEHS